MKMLNVTDYSQSVRELEPGIVERTGRSSNDAFPFRFWQSFSLPEQEFSVDFSIDCFRGEAGFRLSSDISTSDGIVLAEYPEAIVRYSLPDDEKSAQIEAWLSGLQSFLRQEAKGIVAQLANANQLTQPRSN
jgi:hypothetical protein